MDSRPDTYKHIGTVRKYITQCVNNLLHRADIHDDSKLVSPEVEAFDELTDKLSKLDYGSKEYYDSLKQVDLKSALEHHYAKNRHHPQHYPNGIRGMTLLDITEMLCDWKAASERHETGNIIKSIQENQSRFGFSDELKEIFLNTVKELGMV